MGWCITNPFCYFTFSCFVGKSPPPPPTGVLIDVESTVTGADVSTTKFVESVTSFVVDSEPQAVKTNEVETAIIKKYFFI